MVSVNDYNLIKEGDMYNAYPLFTYAVTSSGMHSLYDGDLSSVAYSIGLDQVSSLDIRFGEYFDVSNLKYYASSLNTSDISVGYGTGDTSNTLSLTSSGTFLIGYIEDTIGLLNITHSGSSPLDVYQIVLEGTINSEIGFGESTSSGIDAIFFDNTPIGHTSSSCLTLPIYNDYDHEVDIKVAIAPTGYDVDNYVKLSTTESGTYYGINEYGKKQPAFLPFEYSSHNFTFTDISSLFADWYLVRGSEAFLSSDSSSITFNVTNDNPYAYRQYNGNNDLLSFGLLGNSSFTSDQSFTVGLKIKIDDFDFSYGYGTQNKFLFGFTDSYLIPSPDLTLTSLDKPSDLRGAGSFAAVWVGSDNGGESLYVGGAACASSYAIEGSDFNLHKGEYSLANPILSAISLESVSSDILVEPYYNDGDDSAPWRQLWVTYNHIERTAYFYLDNILLSSYEFDNTDFYEKCKIFMSFIGMGSATISIKDFEAYVDKVLHFDVPQSLSGVSSEKDPLQGAFKLIDGSFDVAMSAGAWVSDDHPTTTDYIDVTFSGTVDIDAVRIKQPSASTNLTISGTTSPASRYRIATAEITFDTDDVRFVDFYDSSATGPDGWDVRYLANSSGTVSTVSGVSSARMRFYDIYDRGSSGYSNVLAIDEVQYYNVTLSGVSSTFYESEEEVPWSRGKFYNLKKEGDTPYYTIRDTSFYDVSSNQQSWQLTRYADYDLKNPVISQSYKTSTSSYHYSDSIFQHTRLNGASKRDINMYSGPTCWFWRFFEKKSKVKAVYVENVYAELESTAFNSLVDEWKVQYLLDGADPNNEASWVDIPPITTVYPTGSYNLYTQYLVDNNDGEYYTNFKDLASTVSTVTFPIDSRCRSNSVNPVSSATSNGFIYLEFDDYYYTHGIRVVYNDGVSYVAGTPDADGYSAYKFVVYGDTSSGAYVSPVFDTGTKQNTERIYCDVVNGDGTSRVLYRSNESSPSYMFDPMYEEWEDLGNPFAGLGKVTGFPYTPSMASDGTYIYIVPQHPTGLIGSVYKYDPVVGRWSVYTDLPEETDGSVIGSDPETVNNLVYIGDTIIMASRSGDGPYTSGLSRLHLVQTLYLYDGWDNYPYQRQASAVYSTMVSDGTDRIFFLGSDLEITVFYLSTGALNGEGRSSIPAHGGFYRDNVAAYYLDDKLYVAGGNNGSYLAHLDIYDVNSDTWTSGPEMPYTFSKAQMVYEDGYLYVFPLYPSGGSVPTMKYQISTGTWYVVPSLSYNTATCRLDTGSVHSTNAPVPYSLVYHEGYVYAFSPIRNDFRRCKLRRTGWVHGYLPSIDPTDYLWLNSGGEGWHEITTVSGQLMPQDRYIQYKVEMEAPVSGESPKLVGGVVVQPLTLESVQSGSYKNVYVKTYNINEDSGEFLNAKLKIFND